MTANDELLGGMLGGDVPALHGQVIPESDLPDSEGAQLAVIAAKLANAMAEFSSGILASGMLAANASPSDSPAWLRAIDCTHDRDAWIGSMIDRAYVVSPADASPANASPANASPANSATSTAELDEPMAWVDRDLHAHTHAGFDAHDEARELMGTAQQLAAAFQSLRSACEIPPATIIAKLASAHYELDRTIQPDLYHAFVAKGLVASDVELEPVALSLTQALQELAQACPPVPNLTTGAPTSLPIPAPATSNSATSNADAPSRTPRLAPQACTTTTTRQRHSDNDPSTPASWDLIDAALSGDATPAEQIALSRNAVAIEQLAPLDLLGKRLGSAFAELGSTSHPRGALAMWRSKASRIRQQQRPARHSPQHAATSSGRRSFIQPGKPQRRLTSLAAAVLVAGLAVVMLVDVIPRIREQARANTARGTVANLQLALIAYRYDFDRYPPSGHDSLVRYLDGDPSNGGPNKGYFPFVASLVTDELHYLDPWGRPYTYSASNAPDDATCEITSSGPLDSPSASVITWLWGRIARTTDETPATDTAQD